MYSRAILALLLVAGALVFFLGLRAGEPQRVFWVLYGVVLVGFLGGLYAASRSLEASGWSLGNALKEILAWDAEGRPVQVESSSRLIAFLGLLAILAVDLGLAGGILWGWLGGRDLPDLEKIGSFLYGQALIFAPYAFNQLRGGLQSLGDAARRRAVDRGGEDRGR